MSPEWNSDSNRKPFTRLNGVLLCLGYKKTVTHRQYKSDVIIVYFGGNLKEQKGA